MEFYTVEYTERAIIGEYNKKITKYSNYANAISMAVILSECEDVIGEVTVISGTYGNILYIAEKGKKKYCENGYNDKVVE